MYIIGLKYTKFMRENSICTKKYQKLHFMHETFSRTQHWLAAHTVSK